MTNFKTLLDEQKAKRILQDGSELSVKTEVKRWWPDVHEDSVSACVDFLNEKTSVLNDKESRQLYVENPLVDGVPLSGRWRLVYAGTEEGRSGIVQILRKGFVESLIPSGRSDLEVDWSEFILLKNSGYHADHEMPVLRLNNVAPEAAAELVEYLNQDSFTDIVYRDGILSGTWRRVEVRSEREDDGSYHIDVLLTDSANTSLYVRFLAFPTVWKGLFHKWDADETTIAELESTIQFNSTGEIVESGGHTLREAVSGRTVQWSPVRRAGDTRLFELVAEITWTSAQFLKDEATAVSMPDSALTQESSGAGGKITPRCGTVFLKKWTELGVKTDKLPVDDNGTIAGSYDADNGLFVHETSIAGLSGPTIEVDDQGRYSWRVNHLLASVNDPLWHVWAIGRDWKKREDAKASSWQQLRRRIGGETQFYEVIDENGNSVPSPFPWNSLWSWVPNYPYPAGYSVARKGLIYTSKNSVAGITPPESDATNWEISGDTPTYWVDGGYFALHGRWKSFWRKSYSGAAIIPGNHLGSVYSGLYTDGSAIAQIAVRTSEESITKTPVFSFTDGKLYRVKLNTSVVIPTLNGSNYAAFTAGTLYRIATMNEAGVTRAATSSETTTTASPTAANQAFYNSSNTTFYVSLKSGTNQNLTSTDYFRPVKATWIYRYAFNSFTAVDQYRTCIIGSETTFDVGTFNGAYNCSPSNATYGIGQTKCIWEEFSEENVKGVIGVYGIGLFPENTPDLRIPILSALSNEVDWDSDWSWKAGTYQAGHVLYHVGKLWKASVNTSGVPGVSGDWVQTTTDQPTDWIAGEYNLRYGVWVNLWRKSYSGAAIIPGNHLGSVYVGMYSSVRPYPISVVNGDDAITKTEVCSFTDGLLYRIKLNASVPVPTLNGSNYAAFTAGTLYRIATINEAGTSRAPTGSETTTTAQPTAANQVYYNSSNTTFYVSLSSAPSPQLLTSTTYFRPVKATWIYRYAFNSFTAASQYRTCIVGSESEFDVGTYVGAYGLSPDNATYGIGQTKCIWEAFDESYVSGKIGTYGMGIFPENDVLSVSVISQEGTRVYSSSARVQFSSNPHENPEYFEAGQRLKRREDVVIFRTFYAINPVFVTNSRIPQSIENIDQNLLTVATPTGEKIFHKDDPNLSAEFRTLQLSEYLWCHELVLNRKGEYLADETVLSSDPEDGATGGLMNGSNRNYPAVDPNGYWGIYHRIPAVDSFTGQAAVTGKPAGAFKDVG